MVRLKASAGRPSASDGSRLAGSPWTSQRSARETAAAAALAADVVDERAVDGAGEARPVQGGEQGAAVGIAEIGLGPRRLRQPGHDGVHDAVGAVAAAREPDGVEGGVVGGLDEGLGAGGVGAGEMAFAEETLRMEHQLGAFGFGQGRDQGGDLAAQRSAGGRHGDAHGLTAPVVLRRALLERNRS
jgi:hypothetical protein